jgi:hypothetical protein
MANRELTIKLLDELRVQSRARTPKALHAEVNRRLETKVEEADTLATLELLVEQGKVTTDPGGLRFKLAYR